jgi:hypothetical protein
MATESPLPANAALASILQGLSATQGLNWFRSIGGHVGNETWYQLRGQVEASIALREGIYNEPQHLRPTAQEIQTMQTKGARGYIQQVEVLVRAKGSTDVISVPYSSQGKTLRSRQAIVREAISVYGGENAKKYGQTVLGAVYTGTYELAPQEG